jgi:outer membrane protein
MLNKSLLGLMLFVGPSLLAQDTLSLRMAMENALQSNFNIAIARNELKIAENNNHAGAAGMLPDLVLGIGDTPASSNIRQEFVNGTEIARNNVRSNAFQANVALNWTLFDGGRMFIARDRLQQLEESGELLLNIRIQNVLSEVISGYYRLQSLYEYLDVLEKLLQLSEARYATIKVSLDAGLADKSELQLAEIDRLTGMQGIVNQKMLIDNAARDLNVLIGRPAETPVVVGRLNSTMQLPERAVLDDLFAKNPEFILAQNQAEIALQLEKESKAALLPVINMNAGYGYNLSQSEAGFSLYNLNYGPSANFGLSFPIFTGRVNKRNYDNAKIERDNALIREKQTTLTLQSNYQKAWNTYLSLDQQIQLDQSSVIQLNEYVEIMEQNYTLRQSTLIEYRQAQYTLETASYRLINNKFLQQLAALDLMRLAGILAPESL